MSWSNYFSTSVGKKIQMALTGLFLVVFLVVHCYINSLIWVSKEAFEEAAHFMGTNMIIHIAEVGLFGFLILHIVQGLQLWMKNRKKRSSRYAVSAGNATSKWYSRSMGILGSLLLIFLVLHTSAFWAPNRISQISGNGELDLFEKMHMAFQNPVVVIIYILGCIALAWHLVHGFFSAFQTLGLATNKYKQIIKTVGVGFSIIIPFIFIMMPLSFYFGWVS
ncbi:MAG: succinate dehydrogenase cytochrome b subunit [Flavipsychrobacter sp.]